MQMNRLNHPRERLMEERGKNRCKVWSRLVVNKKTNFSHLSDRIQSLSERLCTPEESREDYIKNLCAIFYILYYVGPIILFFHEIDSSLLLIEVPNLGDSDTCFCAGSSLRAALVKIFFLHVFWLHGCLQIV